MTNGGSRRKHSVHGVRPHQAKLVSKISGTTVCFQQTHKRVPGVNNITSIWKSPGSSSSKSLKASINLKRPDLSYMHNHALEPHLTSMKVLNPLLSMWNQVRAPRVAARPHRISPIGGGIPRVVLSQATRSEENLGVGLTGAVPIGNSSALRILPASDEEASRSWSDEAVVIWEFPASSESGSTRIDWSAILNQRLKCKEIQNVPCTSIVSLGLQSVLRPSLSNWMLWAAQSDIRMCLHRRISWTSEALNIWKCLSDITEIADFDWLIKWIGYPSSYCATAAFSSFSILTISSLNFCPS